MFCSGKEEKDADRTDVTLLSVGMSHWFYSDCTTMQREILKHLWKGEPPYKGRAAIGYYEN